MATDLDMRLDGWQPIETAPKDGTLVNIRSEKTTGMQPFWWDAKRKQWATWVFAVTRRVEAWWDETEQPVTHWMPLSPPPEVSRA